MLTRLVRWLRTSRMIRTLERDLLQRQANGVLSLPPCGSPIWIEPYQVGHFTTLLTLSAYGMDADLTDESLAFIQLRLWTRFSAQDEQLLAYRITSLSLEGDHAFLQGCRDAQDMMRRAHWSWMPESEILGR